MTGKWEIFILKIAIVFFPEEYLGLLGIQEFQCESFYI